MPTLVLLRHAEAEDANAEGDRARRLTEVGRAHAVRIGAMLAARGLVPDEVLASPAVRCLETAHLALRSLAGAGPVTVDGELYDAGLAALRVKVAALRTPGVALVVGHNPGLSELAGALASRPMGLHRGDAVRFRLNAWGDVLRGVPARETELLD